MNRQIEQTAAILALALLAGVAATEAQLVFTDVTEEAGVAFTNQLIESLAWGDYDNDGDEDLYLTGDGPNHLLRNDSPTGHHWLGLRLAGTASNRSAIGARVTVTTSEGSMVQEISGGAGRGSQNSLPLEFGLGAATVIEELTVRWPSGTAQSLRNVDVDQYIDLTEPFVATRRSGGRRIAQGGR